MNLLSLINSSLEVVCCSTPLSNHCIIGLLDSSRDFTWGYGMNFVSYPHLILLISGQTFEVTVAHEKFWEPKQTLSLSCKQNLEWRGNCPA